MRARSCTAYLVALLALAILPTQASAWDGSVAGTIAGIENWGSQARIWLTGTPAMCSQPSNNTSAWIQGTPDVVKSLVATALAAKLSGANVVVFSNNSAGSCSVGVITIYSP